MDQYIICPTLEWGLNKVVVAGLSLSGLQLPEDIIKTLEIKTCIPFDN